MKILTLLLATAALAFASCASAPAPKKCCGDSTSKACPANDANSHAKPHAKHKAS